MTTQRLVLGFLASGNGSSAQTIVQAIEAGTLAADARLMVSNIKTAPALDFARAHGIDALCVPTKSDPDAADLRLAEAMQAHGVEMLVLSGYLRRLGPETLRRYGGRILNIHPGPLPAFGGHGMYGRRVHEAVLASGARESGVVIHLVDEEYDHGPTVAQRSVPVLPDDTAETLEARVRAEEPGFFLETLQRIASGQLALPTSASGHP